MARDNGRACVVLARAAGRLLARASSFPRTRESSYDLDHAKAQSRQGPSGTRPLKLRAFAPLREEFSALSP
jgi:hypothetical protein